MKTVQKQLNLKNKINHLEKNKANANGIRKKTYKEFIKNNKLIFKSQQRFRNEKPNIFTEDVDKVALTASNDKRLQPIDSIEPYAYGTNKDLVCKKQEIKCNNIIKQYKNYQL